MENTLGCSYFDKEKKYNNGRYSLRLKAGQHIQALHSQCGISFEKLPLAASLFLELFFGEMEQSVRNKLVLSSGTYDTYATRTMKTLHKCFLERFNTDRTVSENFRCAYLIVDSSQAGDRNVTLKPIITQDWKGRIALHILTTDFVHSKKGNFDQ